MEQLFASLSKRQTMLLLTSLAFGGAESVESFEHLPDDESELLKHRAQALLQIPKDKRIPFLVQEIKRLVTTRRKQLASADPVRLAELLSLERGATVEVLLRALPSSLAEAVRHELPERAPTRLRREVSPAVLSIVRWKLEDALKQRSPGVGTFKFTDLLTLQARELLAICDRMGARALATAFAGLGDAQRDELFARLTPDQRALALRATEAGRSRRLTEPDSRTVLEIFGAVADPSTGMRSAGAQRVVRACVAQGAEFVARMIERHPNELGRLLQRWVRDERARVQRGDGGRMDIVEQMERLAQRGVIDRPMRLPPPPRVAAPEARADSRPLERPAAPAEVRLAPPRAESRQFEKVSPRAESRQFEKVPPRADSRQFEKVSPRADSRQFEKVAPRAESRQFEKVAPRPEVPRADSRQVEKVLPSAESRPETARPAERADSRSQEAALPGGKVLAPPPRLKDPNAQRSAVSPPGRRVEAPAGSRPPQEAPRGFRDVIAQREARKAGVLSSRLPPGRGDLSGSAPAARIMRDGKLMRTTGSRGAVQRPRALTTSPPLQDIPKRRGGGTTETARSGSQKAVVLKNRPGDKKS